MPAICPANSTDCLLRALIDANSGYNWNPLNFAFTAALSILGFVVATVTLISGLLAAGPGRLKASRSAVGYAYSQKSHTRFDRTELRFRTLVRVPVLDIYKLIGTEEIPAPRRSRVIRVSQDDSTAGLLKEFSRSLAGWSRLLEDLNLENFSFATLPCATDYLPADVQAAPAYASVESLVIMALLAGCGKIQPAEGFLRATGPNLQLEFRSHATLGTVAVYQHYFFTSELEVDSSYHGGTIHEALGHLRYAQNTLFELNVSSTQQAGSFMDYEVLAEAIDKQRAECNHPGCASRKETVASWTSFLQDEKPNQGNIDKLATLLFADKPTTARMFPTAATDFRRLLNDLGNRKYQDTWFHQSTVAEDLAVLPESEVLIDMKNLEQFKALRTREVQNRDDSTWLTTTRYFPRKPEGFKLANFLPSKSNDQMSCLRSMAFEAFQSDSMDTKVLKEDSIIVSDQALTACFSWLANSELFMTMDSESRLGARDNLMLQLREVDLWLRRHGGSDALCCALNMIKDLQSLSPLGDEAENPVDKDDSSNHDQDEPTPRKRKPLTESRRLDQADDSRPTYIRCNRKWLAPETLNHYNLPWEFDRRDPAYLIINEWIPANFQEELFEHTRELKAEESEGLTADLPHGKQSQSYFVRRHGKGHRPGAKSYPRGPSGRAAPWRLRRYAGTGPTRRADSKETENAGESKHDSDFGVQIRQGGLENFDNHPRGPVTGDNQLSGRSATIEDHESLDRRSLTPPKIRGLDPAHEQSSEQDEGGKPDEDNDAPVQDLIVTSDGLSSNKSEDGKTSRMKAMETMLLYRAMLFACVLATGTDTSDLLWLENRNRVVQVL